MRKLENKVAIITGGTSGIGLATVERFSEEGAKVVFCGRRTTKGNEIEKRLQEAGHEVFFVNADCSIESDMYHLIDETIHKYKKIDVLFNNAGVFNSYDFQNMNLNTDYDIVFNTNIRSYFILCKLALKHMVKSGTGSIINTASIGGLVGGANMASYCSSKGAVIQLTRSLAKEFACKGVRINSVSPGLIYTEMMPRDAEYSAQVIPLIPMGRGGEAREVANAVLFLASEDASFCNGINLVVDGGQTA